MNNNDPQPYSTRYDTIDDLHDNAGEIIEYERWRNMFFGFLIGISGGALIGFFFGLFFARMA